ncbi:MAG: hypothetical protein LBT38_00285 [Deltaproteobacteria bacterium]|jgi:dihydroorotate dehydrogenase electron transfer subunit|nr:hypothetical protein [Deltaproteobacteria bacterium]
MTNQAQISLVPVKKIVGRGQGAFQLTIQAPPGDYADPGIFAKLRVLKGEFPLLDRPFSVHRFSPQTGELDFLFRVVGQGTEALAQCQPGDLIQITGPLGQGLLALDPNFAQKPIYLVAGGIGLAPMASLLQSQKEPATLFYGERLGQSLIDRDYINSWAPGFLATSEDGLGYGEKGRVTDLLTKALAEEKRNIFACGPIGLLAALSPLAKAHGVKYYASAEAFMACGLGVCLSCSRLTLDQTRLRLCQDGPTIDGLNFDWNKP